MSQPQGHWLPPRPNLDDTRPFQDETNVFLDDIEQELGVLILQRPENERQFAQDNTAFKESSRDFSRALSCQDCTSPPLLLSPSYQLTPTCHKTEIPQRSCSETSFFICAHHQDTRE